MTEGLVENNGWPVMRTTTRWVVQRFVPELQEWMDTSVPVETAVAGRALLAYYQGQIAHSRENTRITLRLVERTTTVTDAIVRDEEDGS